MVFGSYLSNIKQVSFTLLFIPIISSANSRYGLSFIYSPFHLAKTIFPFLHCYVRIRNFLRSERCPVAVFHCALNLICALSPTAGNAPTTLPEIFRAAPETSKTSKYWQRASCFHSQSPPHIYRGPEMLIEQHYFCISLYLISEFTFNEIVAFSLKWYFGFIVIGVSLSYFNCCFYCCCFLNIKVWQSKKHDQ